MSKITTYTEDNIIYTDFVNKAKVLDKELLDVFLYKVDKETKIIQLETKLRLLTIENSKLRRELERYKEAI